MLIACKNVSFAYEGNTVLQNISFSVESGDYLCIAGENGSGKTTLLKGILGLIKPSQGFIMNTVARGQIGYLPQQSPVQKDFPAGVFEVVLSGRFCMRGLRPFYSRADKEIAMKNLERLDIADLRNRCYRELSGGQQQRVMIARALCAAQKVIALDEPAAGLDPPATAGVYKLLENIVHNTGITVIMVSHDIENAAKYANRILHLQHGRFFFGTAEEYIHSDIGKRFLMDI
jgi:zinc transport system ATP-binding protein